jgi:hypothetical protein
MTGPEDRAPAKVNPGPGGGTWDFITATVNGPGNKGSEAGDRFLDSSRCSDIDFPDASLLFLRCTVPVI